MVEEDSGVVDMSLHVCILGSKTAERHDRMCYGVRPDVGLGWRPYTVRVTLDTAGYRAFYSVRDFKRWMGGRYKLKLYRSSRGASRYSVAHGHLEVIQCSS